MARYHLPNSWEPSWDSFAIVKAMSGDEKYEDWKEPRVCEAVYRIDEGAKDSYERLSKLETFLAPRTQPHTSGCRAACLLPVPPPRNRSCAGL